MTSRPSCRSLGSAVLASVGIGIVAACSVEAAPDSAPDRGVERSALVGDHDFEFGDWRVVVAPGTDATIDGFGTPSVHDEARRRFFALADDTLSFDSRGWSLSVPAPGDAAPPFSFSQVYDVARKRVTRFVESDMWTWDGSRWSVAQPRGAKPSARAVGLTVYDPDRERVVLVGGLSRLGAPLNDTWLWDGTDWTEVETKGITPRITSLDLRDYQRIYDTTRKRVVILAAVGAKFSTYLFDGIGWTLVATPSPPFRSGSAFVWDETSRAGYLFGGTAPDGTDQSDMWRWDGDVWTEVTPKAPALSPTPRSLRATGKMVSDVAHGALVVFGGSSSPSNTLLEDTWVWNVQSATWTKADAPSHPTGRHRGLFAYDPDRQAVVLSGGTKSEDGSNALADTWLWDGSKWTLQSVFAAPSTRRDAVFVYDPISARGILFGGRNGTSGMQDLADTWSWNGSAWTAETSAANPPARSDARAIYDPAGARVLLFGGRSGESGVLDDTWAFQASSKWTAIGGARPTARRHASFVYDATNTRAVVFGGLAQNGAAVAAGFQLVGSTWSALPGPQPEARADAALVHDPKSGNVLLFGGQAGEAAASLFGDTWTLDKSGWKKSVAALAPPARAGMQVAFDPVRKNVVLFGGYSYVSGRPHYERDTWIWDGAAWTKTSAEGPPARAKASFVVDASRGRLVLTGGEDGEHVFGDAWSWDGTRWSSVLATRATPSGAHASAIYDRERKAIVVVPELELVSQSGIVHRSLTYVLSPYGNGCTTAADCGLGSCVDGVCCAQPACARCERCDDPSKPGTCALVTSAPDPDSCANESTCDDRGACKQRLGRSCVAGFECASGFCVDGVCCEKACDGQCEACAESGSEGRCQPVRGKPRGVRPDCEGASTEAGLDAALCERPACNGGTSETLVTDRCGGTIGPCAPFACTLRGCSERCSSNEDCDAAAFCDVAIGTCRPRLTCDGDHTLIASGLAPQSCAPYRCVPGGGCRTDCTSVADCVSPSECSRDGRCVAPLTAEPESGCTVHARSSRSGRESTPTSLALTVALALLVRRRRRLHRRGSP